MTYILTSLYVLLSKSQPVIEECDNAFYFSYRFTFPLIVLPVVSSLPQQTHMQCLRSFCQLPGALAFTSYDRLLIAFLW